MADEGFWDNIKQGDFGGLGQNLWEGARDEWLGIDDFKRIPGQLSRGDFLKALKSLGAGTLELGGTALMVVPGANVAALAAKGGKAGKVLKLLKPLSLEERAFAKTASARGIPRSFRHGVELGIGPELAETVAKSPFKRIIGGMTDEFGYGPGGVLGSLTRGVGQATGQLPSSQGALASGILGGRIKAPYLSGKLGTLATRTGIDTQLMNPFMGGEVAAVAQENPISPQYSIYDILAALRQQNSPYAAY